MSGSIQQSIRNGMLANGAFSVYFNPNLPGQYKDRQFPYFNDNSALFRQKKLQYASDFIAAEAQGLFPDAPTEWTPCRIRMADVVNPSSAIQRDFDDYKMIIMESPQIEYVPHGTKFKAMGSYWLMWNPINISASDGSGVVRRCKAVWNHLDYYGNVLSEPFVVESERASANDADYNREVEGVTKGYFNVFMQYNEQTAQLGENSRMILGRGAYRITGYSDFFTEFTGDYSTVRVLRFTIRYEEPKDRIDDMVNHVAGGLEFNWRIRITGTPTVGVGASTKLTAGSVRNGSDVVSTEEYPITYLWESSDESVCSVDEGGNITGIAPGNAVITAKLAQNPEISQSVTVTVAEATGTTEVRFTSTLPEKMSAYQTLTVSAAQFRDGAETGETVEFDLSGAKKSSYTAIFGENSVEITCWGGSVTPLTVTASCGEDSVSSVIGLVGI